ncbi:MAG TPA: thiamine phosphate synthase [Bryobacteraceae bacterium]|nr:thiamine phosphate synthase [Bryobacteraceae bacterium]
MILPRLYPILDTAALAAHNLTLPAAAAACLDAGVAILQIRHKTHWSREIYEAAQEVARLCREAGADLIVNDRADFALLLNAGLHVGQDDLPPRECRKILGSDALLGFSSHNAAQLAMAGAEPVSYVALGPVFPTASKHNPDPVVGLDEVRRIRTLTEKPLVAIGGITLANALDILRAGADSVAVISGLLEERCNPRCLRQRVLEWQNLLKAA